MPKMNFERLIFSESEESKGHEQPKNEVSGIGELLAREREHSKNSVLNTKLISRKKLIFNKGNDYSQDSIETLADSILRYKLQNIPSGYYDEELDRYVLENGERRTRALDFLLEKYRGCNEEDKNSEEYRLYVKNVKMYEQGHPFHIVEAVEDGENLSEVEKIDHRLRLIDCNTESRNDPAERMRHIQEKKELLERRRELTGMSEVANINKEIAKTEGISERQVQKYNAVSTLIPELQELFKVRQISLNDGEYYAGLPTGDQQRILELLRSGEQGSAREIQTLNEQLKRKEEETETIKMSLQKELADVKAEKEAKEEAIATLVEATKRQAAEEQQRIRAELEEEYRKNKPNPEQISALQTRLTSSENKFKMAVQALDSEKEKNRKKDAEILKLKTELDELVRKAKEESGESRLEDEKEKIKTEITYHRSFALLSNCIADFTSAAINNFLPVGQISNDVAEIQEQLEELQKRLQIG